MFLNGSPKSCKSTGVCRCSDQEVRPSSSRWLYPRSIQSSMELQGGCRHPHLNAVQVCYCTEVCHIFNPKNLPPNDTKSTRALLWRRIRTPTIKTVLCVGMFFIKVKFLVVIILVVVVIVVVVVVVAKKNPGN